MENYLFKYIILETKRKKKHHQGKIIRIYAWNYVKFWFIKKKKHKLKLNCFEILKTKTKKRVYNYKDFLYAQIISCPNDIGD